MKEIRLKIPYRAVELICELWGTRNTIDPYHKFVQKKEIETMELRTFGMLITPIDRTHENGTVERVGYVTYWENGMLTVSKTENANSILLNVIDWSDQRRCPTQDECLTAWLETISKDGTLAPPN